MDPTFTPFTVFLLKPLAWVSFLTFIAGLPLLMMRVRFPMQVGLGEAINVEFALTLLRGLPLYHDPSQAPYLYTAYPPLYPWLQAQMLRVVHNVWMPGRLLAFSAYLGCGLQIWLWGRHRWGWPLAMLLSSLFWLFPTWALWGTMDRCDALYLFFHFSAFLLLYREEMERTTTGRMTPASWRRIGLAGFLAALSILVKQNAATLLAVYGIYCAIGKRWRELLFFLAFSLVPVFVVFGTEEWLSHGAFLNCVFPGLNTGLDWANLAYFLLHPFIREGGPLVLTAAILGGAKRVNRLLAYQALFSLLPLLFLARFLGAENYFMEFLLYGVFFAGESLVSTEFRDIFNRFRVKKPATVSALFFSLLVLLYASATRLKWPNLPPASVVNTSFDAMEILKKPGEDLALDLDLLVMAGKKIWVQPAEYTTMVTEGAWSAGPLLEDIREKKFATIEVYDWPNQYLLPRVVVEQIGKYYHPVMRKYGRIWLAPNG